MRIKHLILTAALLMACLGASAQDNLVKSAEKHMRMGHLDKAKAQIDKAVLSDDYKGKAATWNSRALIYSRIGGDSQGKHAKYKDLAPDWADQAHCAALECRRLDKRGEFKRDINEVLTFVGNEFHQAAERALRAGEYIDAEENAEKAFDCFSAAGRNEFAKEVTMILEKCKEKK